MTSKAVLPRFYGLKTEKSALGTCLLRFGELNGAQSYTNESVTIIWPDGSSDQISFNRDFWWKPNGDPEVKETWFLNGSEVSGKNRQNHKIDIKQNGSRMRRQERFLPSHPTIANPADT
ncbi:MAG: hypothetical protein ACLR1G_13765 [Alistipes indistinctus]